MHFASFVVKSAKFSHKGHKVLLEGHKVNSSNKLQICNETNI